MASDWDWHREVAQQKPQTKTPPRFLETLPDINTEDLPANYYVGEHDFYMGPRPLALVQRAPVLGEVAKAQLALEAYVHHIDDYRAQVLEEFDVVRGLGVDPEAHWRASDRCDRLGLLINNTLLTWRGSAVYEHVTLATRPYQSLIDTMRDQRQHVLRGHLFQQAKSKATVDFYEFDVPTFKRIWKFLHRDISLDLKKLVTRRDGPEATE